MSEDGPGRFVEINGASLYYEERGNGPPVILIHGGLGSSTEWESVVSELMPDLWVITPDSRGHGRSTNPGGELSYTAIADDVAALIAALGLARPVVGGWSDGGQVVLELGARHPGAAGALIVGAAYPDFAASGLREAHRALLGADDAGVPDPGRLDAQLGDSAELIKSAHPGGSARWTELVRQTAPMWLDYAGLRPQELRRIQAPTLVLGGDRDEFVSVDLAVSLYRALPNAELAICPRTEHEGPTPERAAVFASLIRDFVLRHAQMSAIPQTEELNMLADTKAYSGIAVNDMQKARAFYGEALGLRTSEEYGLLWLHLAGDRDTLVYEQPDATPASYTILNFEVDDIDTAVDQLTARGVHFERYDDMNQDGRGVFRDEGPYIAWFKDPSGNVLSVLQEK
jgi:pimeloyl-ACP methyl ester carboxylesterase/catechol 2,3-dioxygenase-like lactoylglutathione lyase family enzyme